MKKDNTKTLSQSFEQLNAYYGKVPPQAVEVEEAVLGALMLERDAFQHVQAILTPESFYKYEHQKIFNVISELAASGKPIDLLVVTQALKNKGELDEVGGPLYITQLTSRIASAAHIENHARIIAQKDIARKIIRLTTERCDQAYDQSNDIDDIISGLQNDLMGLMQIGHCNETTIAQGLEEIQRTIAYNQQNKGLSGIGTGLYKLDKLTGGLQKTDLVVIAGDSSQGKTSLALTILKNAVMKFKARAAVYSLEMSSAQLIARIIATETGIPSNEILSRCLTYEEAEAIERITAKLSSLPVYFDEASTSTIDQICNSIRRLVMKKKINLVVVDYLQLVGSGLKNKTDESQLAEIARRLKNIAKELNITVIALSQFNRNPANPRPTVSRLRGSGQIVEASDLVLLVWRPEYYGLNEFTGPFEGTPSQGLAECIIAKGRNVGTGTFLMRFDEKTTGFYDYCPELSGLIPENSGSGRKAVPYEPGRDLDDTPF
ncbi:replicative DNA helicase [bacterium]|nr:replicative DNA helicase [bacterium]MBV5348845.1 replicative DNA helicase [bacterium]